MDVVVRPAKPQDAEGLARAARDLAEQYAALEPERFRVPDREAQLASLNSMLQEPLAANSVWLVAEVEGEAVGDACAQLHEPMGNAAVQPQLDVGAGASTWTISRFRRSIAAGESAVVCYRP